MNRLLLDLANPVSIAFRDFTHTARHSFATSVALANGVSIENVAKMLGHSDTKMTRHYARVLDKSIMRDMQVVNGKFAKPTAEPVAPEAPALTPHPMMEQLPSSARIRSIEIPNVVHYPQSATVN